MNALQSYSSDEESGNEAPMAKNHKEKTKDHSGTNYDPVGMDISEDSDEDEEKRRKHQNSKALASSSQTQRCPTVRHTEDKPKEIHGNTTARADNVKLSENILTKSVNDFPRSSVQERLLGLANEGSHPTSESHKTQRDRKESRSSPKRDKDSSSRRRSKSKSPDRKKHKSRSNSREKDVARHGGSSLNGSSQKSSLSARSEKDNRSHYRDEDTHHRKSGSDRSSGSRGGGDRNGGRSMDDSRKGSKPRSRSRSRERSRDKSRKSREKSRDRKSRSRSRERRRRSHSRERTDRHERKRPMDIRIEAQQKLAALKASNPDLTAAELLRRSMEAQVAEVQKQTGIALPSYYNPAAMNPVKFAEQERKKKLLWGNKSKAPEPPVEATYSQNVPMPPMPIVGSGSGASSIWASTKFSNDRDGKMAEKFKRLMGVKNAPPAAVIPLPTEIVSPPVGEDILEKQETMFSSMERQYEVARLATHTHKGFGLGFSSQSFVPK